MRYGPRQAPECNLVTVASSSSSGAFWIAGRSRNSPPLDSREQRLYFAAQFGIGLGQQRRALLRRFPREPRGIALRFAGNAPGSCLESSPGHTEFYRLNSRNSQALARFQSRLTVRGEMFESRYDLLLCQSAEIAQLDNLGLARRHLRERCQGLVDRKNGSVRRRRQDGGFVQIHFGRYSAAPARTVRASGIHQDAPHHLGRDRKELRARLPFDVGHVDQAEVDLVD